MLPGQISSAGPPCAPGQLMVARPKASAPHTRDHGPIRQLARPRPSCLAATDMSGSRPPQNAASAIAPHRIWSSGETADTAMVARTVATATRSRPAITNSEEPLGAAGACRRLAITWKGSLSRSEQPVDGQRGVPVGSESCPCPYRALPAHFGKSRWLPRQFVKHLRQ